MGKRAIVTVVGPVATFLLALISLIGVYEFHNRETAGMDDLARGGAPGKFVNTADGMVHYELVGPAAARTVVLIHGFSVPYYIWDPTFEALVKAGFRVLRYDLFGRGWSDRPELIYGPNLFDRQLLNLLGALGITQPVDVAGLSMGGPIAITFACRHPEKVRTVSLFDPGYSTGATLPARLRWPIIGEYWMGVSIAPSLAAGQMADFAHPDRYPDWPGRYREQMQYRGFRRALLSTLRHFTTRDNTPDFRCVGASATPVFVVWGKGDRDVPFAVSQQVLQAIPRAEFLPVEDAAHVPHYEHPEIVNPALVEFLHRH